MKLYDTSVLLMSGNEEIFYNKRVSSYTSNVYALLWINSFLFFYVP